MSIIERYWIISLCFIFTACAPMLVRPETLELKSLPRVESKSSVQYRFYERTPSSFGNGCTLSVDKNYEKVVIGVLEESKYFSKLEKYPVHFDIAQLTGAASAEGEAQLLMVKYPLSNNYFINIESLGIDHGPHGNMLWGLFHLLSLGFIPMKINNDADLKVSLFNQNGNLVFENELKQESSIWAWTPLFFFNGFQLFTSIEALESSNREDTFKKILRNLAEHSKL